MLVCVTCSNHEILRKYKMLNFHILIFINVQFHSIHNHTKKISVRVFLADIPFQSLHAYTYEISYPTNTEIYSNALSYEISLYTVR